MSSTEKARVVLAELEGLGPVTADEFAASRRWYINSWAPTFTNLRQAGLVYRTGEKRITTHGGEAYVVAITDQGRKFLRETP